MAPAENTSSGTTGSTKENGTVLVGIDGSTNSERAFEEALAIVQAKGMGIDLAGAFTFPFGYVDPYNTTALSGRDEFRRIVENRVRQAADPLIDRANAAGVEVHLDIAEGDAAGVLTRWSEKVDLAVVGKRGRSPVAGRFMGSVSSSFVSHSRCPVLVVPEKWKGHSHGPAEARPSRVRATRTRSMSGSAAPRTTPMRSRPVGSVPDSISQAPSSSPWIPATGPMPSSPRR